MPLTSINWNAKGQALIPPVERDRYERGEKPRRLDGKLETDALGNVWYCSGEHRKLVADGGTPTLADKQPDDGKPATGDLDAPGEKPAAKAKAKHW